MEAREHTITRGVRWVSGLVGQVAGSILVFAVDVRHACEPLQSKIRERIWLRVAALQNARKVPSKVSP